MTSETERMLAEGPRVAPEPATAGAAPSVATPRSRELRRHERILVGLLALAVLVGLTVGHLLGPGVVLALWLAAGLVHVVRRRKQ